MAVTWDAVLVRAIARTLNERLHRARARAVHFDRRAHAVFVFFRSFTVELRLHPKDGRLLLRGPAEPYPGAYPLSADLLGVAAPADERRLHFVFRRRRGRIRAVSVVAELMSNQWNAFIVEGDENTIRHVLRLRPGGMRPLIVGRPYEPPAASDRTAIDGRLSPEAWAELTTGEPAEVRKTLLRRLAWTSTISVPGLVPAPGAFLDDSRGYALWHRLAKGDRDAAWLLQANAGPQPYPIQLPHLGAEPSPDLLSAFDSVTGPTDAATGPSIPSIPSIPSDLVGRVENARVKARQTLASLERELERTPDPMVLRGEADLLLARIHEVRAGSDVLTTRDFEGAERTIDLDPSLKAHENADRKYRRAAKASRARTALPERIRQAEHDLGRLDALCVRISRGDASIDDLVADLPDLRADPEAGDDVGRRSRGAPDRARPYRVYRSSGGLEIRVGRGAKHNDQLTFHHSSPNDVWLHARHQAGAHVVLRWTKEDNPPARDLEEAACLAALHSAARHAGVVPVDWTRRKYVRKPRKAPPGSVVVERAKTLFVEPDPDLPERLGA